MIKKSILALILIALTSCSTINHQRTISNVDLTCNDAIHAIMNSTDRFVLSNEADINIDEELLQKQFALAKNFFEAEVDQVKNPIAISIQKTNCFRTGFDFKNNKIVFCNVNNLINYGLDSQDVFNHELFHALLYDMDPSLFTGDMKVYVHEALADYFSYLLNPKKNFGENFYTDQEYIRPYQTTMREGLIDDDHIKGTVLVTQLIKNKTSLKDAIELFKRQDAPKEFTDEVVGVPNSKLNRYRLKRNQELKFLFHFNKDSGVKKIAWETSPEIQAMPLSDTSTAIKTNEPITPTSAIARFYSEDGTELGFRKYYFSLKKD